MEQIYVIECSNKKYYVGKTNDIIRRFEEHKSGKGSAWTSKYKPIRLISCRPQVSEHDENNETKDLMKKYGIEHVRGGSYTQIELAPEEIFVLQKEIIGNVDK
jgi:predicted GIY-YIG superfamily endonuclease